MTLMTSLLSAKTYHEDPDASETVEVLVGDSLLDSTHRLTIPSKQKVDSHVNQGRIGGGVQDVLPEQSSCQGCLSS